MLTRNLSIIILSILAALFLTVCESQVLIGGYQDIPNSQLEQMRGQQEFIKAQLLARQFYGQKHGGKSLGAVINAKKQLVNGFNYKICFEDVDNSPCKNWVRVYCTFKGECQPVEIQVDCHN